ncbi:MAG: endolytic transglycosylase MltG [Actinomycetota bacterium]|nr:endolytic transglycosylase MltG [Actinomycetota bacterium]
MSDIGLDMQQRQHRGPRRRRSRRRVAGCLAVLVSLTVLLALGGFVVVKGRAWLEDAFAPAPDYKGDGRGSVLVEVQSGDTSTAIAGSLHEAGVVASEEAFIDVAREEPRATLIQVGFYDMKRRMSAEAAMERMLDPSSMVTNAVTIPEGYTVEQTLEQAADDSGLGLGELRRAAADTQRLGLPDYAGGELEGFLFPATYELPPNATARQLLRMMVARFEESARRLDLERQARSLGLSPQEVVTVASIVQREARHAGDFPKVARVVYNRLKRGMPLQMDSTVHYAVGKTGEVATTEEDRASSSPYNTYRFAGLPPGPIAAPGDSALEAALDPAEGDWIYFVTVNIATGETEFAVTEAQHQQNVAQLQEFCRQSPRC